MPLKKKKEQLNELSRATAAGQWQGQVADRLECPQIQALSTSGHSEMLSQGSDTRQGLGSD